MEGFTTLDFIWDTYDISIGWVKLLNVVTTASCRRLILNMSHWTTLLWYSIPLIYHNLTEIRHGGEGWLWYEQLSPAGPITVQWGSGLNCMLAKENVLLVYSRHELCHPLIRIPCLYLPNDTGFIHKWQTWYVTVWIMVIMIIVKKKKLWDDTCRCELGTEDWPVHRVILSNVCTDGYLALYRRDSHPIHEAVIHPTETVHQFYWDHGKAG